jgi:hypothetical protein
MHEEGRPEESVRQDRELDQQSRRDRPPLARSTLLNPSDDVRTDQAMNGPITGEGDAR